MSSVVFMVVFYPPLVVNRFLKRSIVSTALFGAALILAIVLPARAQTVCAPTRWSPGRRGSRSSCARSSAGSPSPNVAPLLLVHDTPAAGAASFDLGVPGGSLAVDLAEAGLRVYLMDARGYGRSSRAPRLASPPRPGVPLTRASEVVEDIGAVVDWIRQRTRAPKVALLGWGAGGHAVGQFAARRPDVVAAVVFYNTLYGGGPEHPLVGKGSELADPARPGRINRATVGAYRLYDADRDPEAVGSVDPGRRTRRRGAIRRWPRPTSRPCSPRIRVRRRSGRRRSVCRPARSPMPSRSPPDARPGTPAWCGRGR